eukprot:262432_1
MDKYYTDCGEVHLPKLQFVLDDNKEVVDTNGDVARVSIVSIVHISDTHNKHKYYNKNIPNGDILIHTGDFLYKCKTSEMYEKQIVSFNDWIGKLPHKIKIVICGNHEGIFADMDIEFIHKTLSNVTYYLQDSYVTLYGIKFYGTPWTFNTSTNKAFGIDEKNEDELNKKFDLIPNDTDILLTHLPPFNIHDLAWRKFYDFKDKCNICNEFHQRYAHWGSKHLLKQIIKRIKPVACLFGHVHDSAGKSKKKNILFCNSAMALSSTSCHKFDVVFDIESNKNMDDIDKKDPKNNQSKEETDQTTDKSKQSTDGNIDCNIN